MHLQHLPCATNVIIIIIHVGELRTNSTGAVPSNVDEFRALCKTWLKLNICPVPFLKVHTLTLWLPISPAPLLLQAVLKVHFHLHTKPTFCNTIYRTFNLCFHCTLPLSEQMTLHVPLLFSISVSIALSAGVVNVNNFNQKPIRRLRRMKWKAMDKASESFPVPGTSGHPTARAFIDFCDYFCSRSWFYMNVFTSPSPSNLNLLSYWTLHLRFKWSESESMMYVRLQPSLSED